MSTTTKYVFVPRAAKTKKGYSRQPGGQCRHDWTLEDRKTCNPVLVRGALLVYTSFGQAIAHKTKKHRVALLSDEHRRYAYKYGH